MIIRPLRGDRLTPGDKTDLQHRDHDRITIRRTLERKRVTVFSSRCSVL